MIVPAAELQARCAGVLVAAGLPTDDAGVASGVLVRTTSRGYPSHGVALLPMYLDLLERGVIRADAEVTEVGSGTSTVVVDGGSGMGQVVAHRATEVAIETARRHGLGLVSVRNSNHFGAAGHYALMCAEAGLIGVAWSSTPPTMHAVGGRGRSIGNGPTAFGVPAPPDAPVVFDAAMSVGSGGRVALARRQGKPIPPGWALDATGRPTTDPARVPEGSFVPVGEHKGFGLALLAEVLSTCLSGAALTSSVPPMRADTDRAFGLGHAFFTIDPGRFTAMTTFAERVNELRSGLRSAPRAEGVERIVLPGDGAAERERRSLADGVAVEQATWEDLASRPGWEAAAGAGGMHPCR